MNRVLRSGTTLLFVLLAAPAIAWAQAGGTSVNAAAGLSLATGNFHSYNDAGYSLALGLGVTAPASPFAFRAEGMYNEFNETFPGGGTSRESGITANAIYNLSTSIGTPFVPYAIGGIGYYNTRLTGFDSESDVGWNIGGGVRFPLSGFSVYAEARYHSVSNADVHFAPIVFGVVF